MSAVFDPQRPLSRLRGVGPAYTRELAGRGLTTVEDALYFLPVRYEDRRRLTPLAELIPGQKAVVTGAIRRSGPVGPPRRRRFEMIVEDETGELAAVWFHFRQAHLAGFAPGTRVIMSGRVDEYQGRRQMVHPDLRPLEPGADPDPELVPIYPAVGSIPPRRLRSIIARAVETARDLDDPIRSILDGRIYPVSLGDAVAGLHRPPAEAELGRIEARRSPWHQGLIVNELFYFCLGLALTARSRRSSRRAGAGVDLAALGPFLAALPFTLTAAQVKAVNRILADLSGPRPMSRLLMGDVGSGKTVVAAAAVAAALVRGDQAAVMSPTDVLARQLFRSLSSLLEPLGVEPALLTGTIPADEAKRVRADLAAGRCSVVVGTHALIQESTEFSRLGLVVVDEQHRFGVEQRRALVDRSPIPDLLVMSATPIPRSLALTLYGDLDLTAIDELPPGRPAVVTRVLPLADEGPWSDLVGRELQAGGQVFFVLPVIEASEALGVEGAVEFFAKIRDRFPGVEAALVHGRMDSDEQQAIIGDFSAGITKILVATTVIEVGIDVPGATVMVVGHAERFGLAQLHQLRGRVGRGQAGGRAAQCLLLPGPEATAAALDRLDVLCNTRDGFKVADEDLKRRGPGEFLGRRQSGLPVFRAAHLLADAALLDVAREEARNLIESDPDLSGHPEIKSELIRRWGQVMHLGRVL
jgi:ATP-dependent DNA helicase RecG